METTESRYTMHIQINPILIWKNTISFSTRHGDNKTECLYAGFTIPDLLKLLRYYSRSCHKMPEDLAANIHARTHTHTRNTVAHQQTLVPSQIGNIDIGTDRETIPTHFMQCAEI